MHEYIYYKLQPQAYLVYCISLYYNSQRLHVFYKTKARPSNLLHCETHFVMLVWNQTRSVLEICLHHLLFTHPSAAGHLGFSYIWLL